MSLCECGCGGQTNNGRRFIKPHQVKLMQERNTGRQYTREHLEKLWAGRRANPPTKKQRATETISCACGCGGSLTTPDDRGRQRKFIQNHQTKTLVSLRERPYPPSPVKGRKASEETRRKLSESHKGKPSQSKGIKRGPSPLKGISRGFRHSLETKKKISEANKGDKSHLWRGGSLPAREERTKTVEWKHLRRIVYERDKWCCVVCRVHCRNSGGKNKTIQCHHIVPVRYGGSDDISNLASVCVSCHKRQESLYGKPSYFWGSYHRVLQEKESPASFPQTCTESFTPPPPAK